MILKDRYISGKKYVSENWQYMSDETLAKNLNYSVRAIKMMRNDIGISRYDFSLKMNSTKAKICEMYNSKVPIKEIAGIVGKSVPKIIQTIDYCLSSPRDSITITLKSKV